MAEGPRRIRVAACQMEPVLGDVASNLEQAARLVDEAFGRGATWVVLPEFFPSGMAYLPKIEQAAMPLDGPALGLLRDAARRYRGHVGGSFVRIEGGERYNTFVLVRSDASYGTHDKDIPTMWEGCYYRGGSDDGLIETSQGTVGVALCWEMIRWRTARRLRGRAELVLAGSAWPTYPKTRVLTGYLGRQGERVTRAGEEAPARLARILGVPVAHAGHTGRFRGRIPMTFGQPYVAEYIGQTQVVDARGRPLARLEPGDGAGVAVADVELAAPSPSEPIGDGYWIPEMPAGARLLWRVYNRHARREYRRRRAARAAA